MPCYHPIPAWKGRRVNPDSGKRPIAFRMIDGFSDFKLDLPCGKCPGCIQDRANEWAMRCEHESKLWRYNWFVTLTYSPENLPPGGSLRPKDLQDFWKRVRNSYPGVRYFACGEYGEQLSRPHYHALCFNLLPNDMTSRIRVSDDKRVFESKHLESLWGHGRIQVDSFSPAAAQYVTNYVRKKVPLVLSEPHYGDKVREFQVMSRRPGIGSQFVKKFLRDIYPDGYVTREGGAKRRAPRFYDLTLEKFDTRMLRRVKRRRKEIAAADVDNQGSRLYVREEIHSRRNDFYDDVKGRPFEKGAV